MRFLVPRTLAAKIALLSVGIAAILSISLTVAGYLKAVQGLGERSARALGTEALLTSSLVETWVREREQGLTALASLRSVRRLLETAVAPAPVDLEAADSALGDAAALAPEIDSIALLDRAGRTVRSTDPADDARTFADRPYFRDALAGRAVVSGISTSVASDAPAIFFAVPALGSNGTVIGVVRVRAGLGPVQGFVEGARNRAGQGAQGILIDSAGVVVASTVSAAWTQHPLTYLPGEELSPIAALRGTAKPAPLRFSLSSVQQIGAAQPLPVSHWLYVASLPRDEVEKTARELLRNDIAATVLGLLLSLAVSLLFARRLVASILRLTEATARVVSEGDLNQKIESISDDEVGQLTRSFGRMVDALREALVALKGSAGALNDASTNLRTTVRQQSDFVSRQAAALQETQVTAQEIKQTSSLAAEKASSVLQVAERADKVGKAGETAVERSLLGLADIGHRATEMGEQIKRLSESARQIGGITMTVKDLADQSNMLALNAAIEAVRSGEHGKSFSVVAREIRSLADQSIQATHQVSKILEELTRSIASAVSLAEHSTLKMDAGLSEVRSSGDNLREIVGITRENVAAVRQIAAAVSQQNLGINQIFTAVTEQMGMMEQVRAGIEGTSSASEDLSVLAASITSTLERYRIQ